MPVMSNQKLTQIYPQKKRRIAHEDKRDDKLRKTADLAGPSRDEKTKHLNILREFDMNWKYGPCTNITRMERWNRAQKLEQEPPNIVKDLIEAHPNDKDYTDNVWADYKL